MEAEVLYDAEYTLDRMQEMVEAEMLVHGEYLTDDVMNPERIDAICGGRKACAVGSLWIAHGIKPTLTPYGENVVAQLPGSGAGGRHSFLESHPELARVYEALNLAATEKLYRMAQADSFWDIEDWNPGVYDGIRYNGALETLFESEVATDEPGEGLLEVIARAREIMAETV